MRIALVHNIANNFFAIGRYLRDIGHDAHLFCRADYKKWLPEHDDPDAVNYGWIHNVDLSSSATHKFAFLRDFDVIVTTGLLLPAAIMRAGVPVHCYLPFGGDVSDCVQDFENNREIWRSHFSSLMDVPLIITGTVEPVVRMMTGLKVPHIQGYVPAVYVKDGLFSFERKSKTKMIRIFSPARHLWVSPQDTPSDFDVHRGLKRNDILLKAFDKLCRWSRSSQSELYVVNYGPDFASSLKLIQSFEYASKRIRAFSTKLPRTQLFSVLHESDVMANAFRRNVHQFGTGVQEALSSGCVVANHVGGTRPELFGCPILDASDEDTLFHGLYTLEQSIDLRRVLQKSSAEWFQANLGLAAARRFATTLEYVADKRNPNPSSGTLADLCYGGLENKPVVFEGTRQPIAFGDIADTVNAIRQGRE